MEGALISIRDLLTRRGVPRSANLIVHSAIRTLSHQGIRAEGIVETLLDCVADGNVFMPTMTWRTVTLQNPRWDEVTTPSHTGVLSEVFRTRYATARSIHPTHSAAGWGPNAATMLSRHHLDATPVSNNSPYGMMRDSEAFILLLGVGLESCTAIHLPEEEINPELYVMPANTVETYHCRDRHGVVHRVLTRRHRRLDRDFPQFAEPLAANGELEFGNIMGCPYSLVSLRGLLREVSSALVRNPRATLRQI